MPVYKSSGYLYKSLEELFARIESQDKTAGQELAKTRLILSIKTTDPEAQVMLNARSNPVKITYGSNQLRPDLEVVLPADTLHKILMSEISLSQALSIGGMRVFGPVWKSFILKDIFQSGQKIYPELFLNPGKE